MKILFTTALIIAAVTSLVHAQEGQLRLRPSDINALTSVNAGAGTSGVSGIQTRTLKGDATKSGIYTIQLTIPANVRIQAHTHPDDRVATVISGTWYPSACRKPRVQRYLSRRSRHRMMVAYAYAAQFPAEVKKLALLDAPIPGVGDVWEKIYTTPALWHFHFVNSPIALELVNGRERIFLEHVWQSFGGDLAKFREEEKRMYAQSYAQPGVMRDAFEYFKAFEPTDAADNRNFATTKLPMTLLVIDPNLSICWGAATIRSKMNRLPSRTTSRPRHRVFAATIRRSRNF